MANTNKWTTPSVWTTIMSTQLNSMANAGVTVGTTLVNSTSLELYVDFALRLGSINPTTNPYVELYLLPTVDNNNSADRTSNTLAAIIAITTGSSTKIGTAFTVVLPPGAFLPSTVNQTGVAFAASGNSLVYRTYSEQNNA